MTGLFCHLVNLICQLTNYLCHVTNYPDARRVDCRSIAMSMIRAADGPNIRKLVGFVVSRSACARGGEHQFLRWNESHFDYYFMSCDFEWHTIKQCVSQMMLFFCDSSLFCLCVYWALGAFFLNSGLERHGIDPDIVDYVFPHL